MGYYDAKKYAIKIHMPSGVYTVGPYNDKESATQDAADISDGILKEVKAQKGSILYISGVPDIIEIVSFYPKHKDRGEDA